MQAGDDESQLQADHRRAAAGDQVGRGCRSRRRRTSAADAPATTVNLAAAPAIMAAGSKISLRVNFNKPLADLASTCRSCRSVKKCQAPTVQWQVRHRKRASAGTWTARQSLRFHIRATDTDGFPNNALEEYELIVRPDQTPTVQIENPRRNEERTAVSVVPLQGVAEDDYGIQWLKLIVDRVAATKE